MPLKLWGTCESLNAVVQMPKCEIRPLLTKDLDFTPQDFTAEGYHPIIFQANTQCIRIFVSWFRMSYYEMIPLIPLIHFKGEPKVYYQSAPILYVSSILIVIGARIAWHLNKVCAKFKLSNKVKNMPKVKYINERVIKNSITAITMESEAAGETQAPTAFPNFEKIEPLFNHDALIYNGKLDYWRAPYSIVAHEVQPTTAKVHINNIPNMVAQSFNIPSIEDSPLGAYRLNFSWTLFIPKKISPPKMPITV